MSEDVDPPALLKKLEAHAVNAQRTNTVIGCLVKRFGTVLADGQGHGYRVLITDEEIEALEGRLEVARSVAAAGIVLTLHAAEEKGGTT